MLCRKVRPTAQDLRKPPPAFPAARRRQAAATYVIDASLESGHKTEREPIGCQLASLLAARPRIGLLGEQRERGSLFRTCAV